MRLFYSIFSTAVFASLAAARIPAFAQCGAADISAIPCEAGSVCTPSNSTFSLCLPAGRSGTAAARAARRTDIEKRAGEGGQVSPTTDNPIL